MSFQGVEFTLDMRKMAVNVKLFFDNLKSNADFLSNPATKLAASALGISESTVKIIMAAYNKKGKEGLDWSRSKERYLEKYLSEKLDEIGYSSLPNLSTLGLQSKKYA